MYLYFIQCDEAGPIKIGLAQDPVVRIDDLQVGSPYELRLLAVQPGSITIERAVHRRFRSGHLRGEWFAPETPGLGEHIRRALHCELMFERAGVICEQCHIWPVVPPRVTSCSPECDALAKRERQLRWIGKKTA